jgi:antitoxin HigA-1
MLPKYRKPIHPGEILWDEFLSPMGISQSEFVRHLGGTWTQPKLSSIVCGKRAITETIALDFADALGTSPEFWINLQIDTNLWKAKKGRRKIRRFPKFKSQSLRRKKSTKGS